MRVNSEVLFEGLKEKKRQRAKPGGGCKSWGVSIAAAAPSDQCREQVGQHPRHSAQRDDSAVGRQISGSWHD